MNSTQAPSWATHIALTKQDGRPVYHDTKKYCFGVDTNTTYPIASSSYPEHFFVNIPLEDVPNDFVSKHFWSIK